jgi:SAM-dependent methyltransferase
VDAGARARVSVWSTPATVAGFVQSPPNPVLLRFAAAERRREGVARALDIGCGAGRNAIPLANAGWNVVGIDASAPMLDAAQARARDERLADRVRCALGTMDALPVRDRRFDLLIAHGIWNLARSTGEFRAALREAARVARPGAGLFVFTFSRETLPPDAPPVAGEAFVFTQFSGQPQCFLTASQLVDELDTAGFVPEPAIPLTEYNRPAPGLSTTRAAPVIWEAAFRYGG